MFAVPGDVEPVPGGQGQSVRAGDLVLSPGRDTTVADRLSPYLARLAVDLDTRPGRDHRDLRLALPVPARDGSWVVDGWAATRFEPDTRRLTDLPALRAVGALLHAELARAVPTWPVPDAAPDHRWARAERAAFGEEPAPVGALDAQGEALLRALVAARDDIPLGRDQLVHGDLAGNVLLDGAGAPFVIDLAPSWRPVLWAEAVCVLDAVLWWDADPVVLDDWAKGAARQAMLRAGIFRLLSDDPADVPACARTLSGLVTAS